jgi:general secretion pathway protein I
MPLDKKKPMQAGNGFTLLEVCVAVFVIAIVLLAVYRLQSQTLLMNYSARFYTTAPLLAQMKLAEIDATGLEDIIDESGDFGQEFPGYTWEMGTDEVDTEALEKTAEALKRIDLRILLNGGELEYSLQTYRYLP